MGPEAPITLSKEDACRRQIGEAINALKRGDFDTAITLAGAAEGMFSNRKGSDIISGLAEYPRAREHFTKPEWIAILNMERDWLKHPTMDLGAEMEFTQMVAAHMIARAASKLQNWTPIMKEFKDWFGPIIKADLAAMGERRP
jgi:hypothetical protein